MLLKILDFPLWISESGAFILLIFYPRALDKIHIARDHCHITHFSEVRSFESNLSFSFKLQTVLITFLHEAQ